MTRVVGLVLGVGGFLTLSAATGPEPPTQEKIGQTESRLQDLRKQIEQLQQKTGQLRRIAKSRSRPHLPGGSAATPTTRLPISQPQVRARAGILRVPALSPPRSHRSVGTRPRVLHAPPPPSAGRPG